MRSRRIGVALAAVLLLPGCLVPSVHPLFDESELVFEPALLGIWRHAKDGEQLTFVELLPPPPPGRLSNFYRIMYEPAALAPASERIDFVGRLGRLGNAFFLDTAPILHGHQTAGPRFPRPLRSHLIPGHIFWRLQLDEKQLSLAALSAHWLRGRGRPARPTIQLEWLDADHPLLLAAARDLQAFVLQHAADRDAWETFGPYARVSRFEPLPR